MENYNDITIPVYVINLPERTERLESIYETFKGKNEFELNIIPAIKRERGADGLWQTIYSIVEKANDGDDEVIIICEDDHVFTPAYERDLFIDEVIAAGQSGCQMLLGGIGNYKNAVPLSKNRLWIDWSWCTQFVVLYRTAFQSILDSTFGEKDVADEFLSLLLSNKMVLYPFISRQKDFGYSDVTASNNNKGQIEDLFDQTEARLNKMMEAYQKYCVFQ